MIREIVGYGFIIFGIAFDFFGALGLVRLPDVYNRLQAATKCVTFGSAGILFGVFVMEGFASGGLKALICMVFILLTSPVAAHAISRAAYRSGVIPAKVTVVDLYGDELRGSEDNESTKT
ncbi:monovalent cation/H(+) antiporter subunit G [Kosmotoga pacifica]|uniref:Cation:proton antiporter n=1 Tax=Kosmotoga pacifica TaxID=1330330 RepID=A0A0G2Z7Q2_9BACT|nr:monovalent cation/H(+) antiporter subunit G [Kosmotoga pacifica]AKI97577.1 cation:proton antiporter [Kosmotoga pacifica]